MIDGQLDLSGAPVVTVADRREAWTVGGLRIIGRVPHGWQVSADDLRAVRATWAESCPSPSLWGSLFRRAAAEGLIRADGFHESRLPSRRGGIQRVWRRT